MSSTTRLQQQLRQQQRSTLLRRLLLLIAASLNPPVAVGAQQRRFTPGELWREQECLYRVESCPFIPSAVQLMPIALNPGAPRLRHPDNTRGFQRLGP